MLVLHHATYSINSLCHFFGKRRFDESLIEGGLRLPHLIGNFFSASRTRSEATSWTRGGSLAFGVVILPVSS